MSLDPVFPSGTPVPFAAFTGGLPPEPDDPEFSIPRGALLADMAEPGGGRTIDPGQAELATAPAEPLEQRSVAAPRKPSGWTATLALSCLLHAAVALAFLSTDDGVLIEGSQDAGVLMLGNAADDQAAASEPFPDATQVTLVTMLSPQPAETVTAQTVEAVAAETAAALEPVQPAVQETAAPAEAAPSPEKAEAAENAPRPAPAAAAAVPPILTAQTVEPSADAVPAPVELTAPEPVAGPDAAAPSPAEVAEPVEDSETVQETVAPAPHPKPAVKNASPEQPSQKAGKQPPTAKKEQPAPRKKAAGKAPLRTDKPERTARAAKRSGSGGNGEADARRGVASGDVGGTLTQAGRSGARSAAGNAAVSNYPGKVAAKLRRAARGLSGSRSRGGDVRVSFTVDASGGLAGVRIAASSGSPDLDQAALAVVRRAAPFPPIPPEAGRKSWAFTLPLGVR